MFVRFLFSFLLLLINWRENLSRHYLKFIVLRKKDKSKSLNFKCSCTWESEKNQH